MCLRNSILVYFFHQSFDCMNNNIFQKENLIFSSNPVIVAIGEGFWIKVFSDVGQTKLCISFKMFGPFNCCIQGQCGRYRQTNMLMMVSGLAYLFLISNQNNNRLMGFPQKLFMTQDQPLNSSFSVGQNSRVLSPLRYLRLKFQGKESQKETQEIFVGNP